MGGCLSAHPHSSAMKLQVVNIVKPPADLAAAAKRQRSPAKSVRSSFRDYGSKEETFFDSQAWLDSDCDDDFMSVNGEFTPSRGSTPVHHNFSSGNNKLHADAAVFPCPPSPSVSEKKIRLSDLFKDSLRGTYEFENEQDVGEQVQKGVNLNVESPLAHGTEVMTNNGHGLKTKRERFGRCFPTLLSSRSSSTNGRKMMSPCLG